jgi:hypothetical protein
MFKLRVVLLAVAFLGILSALAAVLADEICVDVLYDNSAADKDRATSIVSCPTDGSYMAFPEYIGEFINVTKM